MLPEISLDTTNFEEIVKKARSQIAEVYPQWTDYNYHDPGITILELFAFLKEAQQFYIDQTSDDIRKKFLQLIGISLEKRKSATTTVRINTINPALIPAGTKFYINSLCFETTEAENIPGNIIKAVIVKPKYGSIFKLDMLHKDDMSGMVIYPFGKKTGVGSEFYICLKKGLETGKTYRLSILLDEHYSVKRNPIKDISRFIPLSKIKITYFDSSGETEIYADDSTLGMIRSGEYKFSIKGDMAYSVKEGIEGYFIKFTLVEDSLDVAPAIKDFSFNDITLVQRDTKAVFIDKSQVEFWQSDNFKVDYYAWNEINGCYIETTPDKAEKAALYESSFYKNRIIAIGNGLPNQKYDLPDKGLMSDSFRILVSSVKDKGFMREWTKVNDFDSSGPDDCHYIVDEENNCIYFGNGIRGRMPENEIRIISCQFSAGSGGNIKAGQEAKNDVLPEYVYCKSIVDSKGGAEPESLEDGFLRARNILNSDERAVSEKDYEKLVIKTPGLRIWDCKVLDLANFSDEYYKNEVHIAVRPYSENGYAILSEAYQKNILNQIMDKRLIGSFVKLYSPIYIEVSVYAELRVNPQYIYAEKKVESVVKKFFLKLNGFGPVINYGALFASIDSLEEVMEVCMLYIDARGGGISRNRNGDVLLPPLGVLLLKNVDCIVIR